MRDSQESNFSSKINRYLDENIPNENFNGPENNEEDDMDENLRRAIEMSKHLK